jgi:hypothetical protein
MFYSCKYTIVENFTTLRLKGQTFVKDLVYFTTALGLSRDERERLMIVYRATARKEALTSGGREIRQKPLKFKKK